MGGTTLPSAEPRGQDPGTALWLNLSKIKGCGNITCHVSPSHTHKHTHAHTPMGGRVRSNFHQNVNSGFSSLWPLFPHCTTCACLSHNQNKHHCFRKWQFKNSYFFSVAFVCFPVCWFPTGTRLSSGTKREERVLSQERAY